MNEEILAKIGLTETQAKIYLALIKNGPLSPVELSDITGETRTNSYAVVEKLIAIGLAKKDESKKMIITAESPEKLKYILAKKQQKIKEVNNDFSTILPNLLSAFCLNNNVTNIINISGEEAIIMSYDSMINTGKDIFILTNGNDKNVYENFYEIMKKQAIRLANSKLKTYMLIQSDNFKSDHKIRPYIIAKPLPDDIKLDARIVIFGQNVIISVFKKDSINSTIITSPEIANTLKSIFFGIWNSNPTDLPGHPDKNIILSVKDNN